MIAEKKIQFLFTLFLDSRKLILKLLVNFKGAHSRITSSKEYDWKAMEADADEENQKFTFDADESPGLYGEVADYWKSYEDNDITDRNETFNDTYDNSTVIFGTRYAHSFYKSII